MKLFIKLSLLLLMVTGCSSPKYLSSPKDFDHHVKGLYIEYKLQGKSLSTAEIIEVQNDYIKVLPVKKDSKMLRLKRSDFRKAEILISSTYDNPKKINTWASLMNVSSLGHGFFAIFSLPINIASTYNITSHRAKGAYRIKYPDQVSWKELHKFARFPQGIPPNINEKDIQ